MNKIDEALHHLKHLQHGPTTAVQVNYESYGWLVDHLPAILTGESEPKPREWVSIFHVPKDGVRVRSQEQIEYEWRVKPEGDHWVEELWYWVGDIMGGPSNWHKMELEDVFEVPWGRFVEVLG